MTLGDKIRTTGVILVNGAMSDGFYMDGDNLVVLYDDNGNDGRIVLTPMDRSLDMTGEFQCMHDGVQLSFYKLQEDRL